MSKSIAATIGELSSVYKVWLCDVWGVVHNGVGAHQGACRALAKHRENGGVVILLTNAPRPNSAVGVQLAGLNVPKNCYDDIVSSGDVTRALVSARAGGTVYFLGPDRDELMKKGMPVTWGGIGHADAVLCTGLIDDKTEQPSDYTSLFEKFIARNLPMICANPDMIVQFGDRLLPCAGALAAHYGEMGGKVEMAGKPYAPIYDLALARAKYLTGENVTKSDCLAIGDGMQTDIAGGANYNLDVAFITGGIHDHEIGEKGSVEEMANIARKAVKGVTVAAAMRNLEW